MERNCGNCKALVREWPDGRKRQGTFGCKLDSGLHYLSDEACTVWVGFEGADRGTCGECRFFLDGVCHHDGGEVTAAETCDDWAPDIADRQRGTVLDEAKKIINGKRQDAYGNPEDCFDTIARLWSSYGVEVTRTDVAVMMSLLKVARIRHGAGDRDNYRDACGYLALACDMDNAEDREKD